MYADELVAGGSRVEVRLFLVHEERIRHPDVADEFGANRQGLDACSFLICKARIRPKLSEVKIQGEVLREQTLRVVVWRWRAAARGARPARFAAHTPEYRLVAQCTSCSRGKYSGKEVQRYNLAK